jgi:TonB family protein
MTGYRIVPKKQIIVPMLLGLAVAGGALAASADVPVGHGELPAPKYPAGSTSQGTVVMHLEVGIDGSVRQVELKHTSGHGDLDQAAMQAARGWRFTPAMEDGKPMTSWISVPVNFEQRASPAAPAPVPQGMLLAAGN